MSARVRRLTLVVCLACLGLMVWLEHQPREPEPTSAQMHRHAPTGVPVPSRVPAPFGAESASAGETKAGGAALSAGSAAAAAPASSSSAPAVPPPARLDVRWGRAGLCRRMDPAKAEQRQRLLSTFQPRGDGSVRIEADPAVKEMDIRATQAALQAGLERVGTWFRPPPPPPTVFVYDSVDDLRAGACVSSSAVAYYDGVLHVSSDARLGDGQLRQSVLHELVHHVLLHRGVRVTMWLQEGLAINVAGETWWRDPQLGLIAWAQREHLPFALMTDAFPHTADEEFAVDAYFQSLIMVETVLRRGGIPRLQELIEALTHGRVAPAQAFGWAVGAQRDEDMDTAWSDTVAALTPLQ